MRLYTENHILVIEDQPDLLTNLCASLRDEGYTVEGVADGQLGLDHAQQGTFDLVVLDMMLPSMNGTQVLRKFRQNHSTPVILLTAIDHIDSKMECFNLGADDYMTKPFHLRELKARIEHLLKSKREQRPSELRIGDITLDTVKRQIVKDDAPLGITHREYSIVEYLALHRGKVVPRDTLYSLFFDESEDALSNVLEVNISTLRKKLGKAFIKTQRGVGYCVP